MTPTPALAGSSFRAAIDGYTANASAVDVHADRCSTNAARATLTAAGQSNTNAAAEAAARAALAAVQPDSKAAAEAAPLDDSRVTHVKGETDLDDDDDSIDYDESMKDLNDKLTVIKEAFALVNQMFRPHLPSQVYFRFEINQCTVWFGSHILSLRDIKPLYQEFQRTGEETDEFNEELLIAMKQSVLLSKRLSDLIQLLSSENIIAVRQGLQAAPPSS